MAILEWLESLQGEYENPIQIQYVQPIPRKYGVVSHKILVEVCVTQEPQQLKALDTNHSWMV